MWNFSGYGSHLTALCRAFAEVSKSKGAVLELGVGDFSTPLLHELCAYRALVSLDYEKPWVDRFLYLRTPFHDIRQVETWENLPEYGYQWDIVLVDHSPAPYRRVAVEALANNAKLLVCHDTESWDNIYQYQYCLPNFKYLVEYKNHPTKTMVVSNFVDVRGWWS